MISFLIRRLLWVIPVLFTVAIVTFFLMHRAPGGPWDREKPIARQTQAQLNARFGLNKPLWFNPDAAEAAAARGENIFQQGRAFLDSQFFNYIIGAAQGNLGPSYRQVGREVEEIIMEKFPASAKLGLVAVIFSVVVGIPLGILGALKQNTVFDYLSLFVATIGVSIPSFVIAILAILFMSRMFGVPPIRRPNEWEGLGTAYILPGIVLGLGTMAFITRLTRASMLEVKRQDYIRTAQAKGLSTRAVIMRHMLRNSLIPVVTILGPAVAALVTGSFIIESIFGVPGVGEEFVISITRRDYSMIMGTTLFYALLVALGNLTVDLSYGFLDPRIRTRH
ncbi:MAG: peptide ABC transporter permease [Herpetosiphonaceae bacterium]|nr:MAG: peptide ABC transporter permease [Herpetosiphonaceae bacterium]